MQKYLITVNGENLLVEMKGIQQRLGFITNVSVEGFTPADAEARAIELVREDSELCELALNSKDDPFKLSAVEVHEIEAFESAETPRTGLVFYPEEQ